MKIGLKFWHWIPRILCIISIVFISFFAFDAFNIDHSAWKQTSDFLINMIPSLILLAILLLAWQRELIGGIMFTLIGIALMPYIYTTHYEINQSAWITLGIVCRITLPFLIVGVLFIISFFKKRFAKKESTQEEPEQSVE